MQHPRRVHTARSLRRHDTWAERLLWKWLRDRRFAAYKFRRQHPLGPYILDFFCLEASLNIELDGSQHGHREERQQDTQRDAYLQAQGIQVLRYWNSQLRREKQMVRDTIWRALHERVPHPVPEYQVSPRPTSASHPTIEAT